MHMGGGSGNNSWGGVLSLWEKVTPQIPFSHHLDSFLTSWVLGLIVFAPHFPIIFGRLFQNFLLSHPTS